MKLLIFTLFCFLFALACGRESLKKLEKEADIIEEQEDEDAKVEPAVSNALFDFCTMDPNTARSNLKFIFVIDKSASNGPTSGDPVGTDPNGLRRYTPLLSFLNNTSPDDSIYYTLINFDTNAELINYYFEEGSAIKTYFSDDDFPTEQAVFTNKRDHFVRTIEHEANEDGVSDPPEPTADLGWTDYIDAMGRIDSVIEADIQMALRKEDVEGSYYIVFFISDGAPRVSGGGLPGGVLQPENTILNAIIGIQRKEELYKDYVERIQLHTGYYYSALPDELDPDYADDLAAYNEAKSRLTNMADIGFGDSLQFGVYSTNREIDFKKFSVPERNVKHHLRDVLVTNINTIWYDGKLVRDSDGDGLADNQEEDLGSDPEAYDSDGNDVGDGVEYYTTKKPCKGKKCRSDLADSYYTTCDKVKDTTGTAGSRYGDSDLDGLNDCEEEILKTNRTDFDSNRDWVPDHLAYRAGLSFRVGTKDALLDTDKDGEINQTEVKLNTPLRFANDRLERLKPYNYNLELTSDDPERSCYGLEVSDIRTFSGSDTIRAYLLENTTIVDDRRSMRTAEKTLGSWEDTVEFTSADFK